MKRALTLLTALMLLAAGLTACGGYGSGSGSGSGSGNSTSSSTRPGY